MDNDAALIERLRQGDENAFAELVRTHQRRVYFMALNATGSHDDADDLVQEVFLKIHRGIKGFRGTASLKTWIYRVTVNTTLNYLRAARRQGRGTELSFERLEEQPAPAAGGTLNRLVRKQERQIVREAIAQLPPKQQLSLTMRIDQDLKFSEIAEALNCSTGAVKANFFHAVNKLKKILKDRP